jgi:hypothetical protein
LAFGSAIGARRWRDEAPASRAPPGAWPPAQEHELAEHRFEGSAIVSPEVGDRLEVGLQAAQQPDDLNVALNFPLQRSARPHTIQIAANVQLQQIARRIARPPRRLRFDPREPRRCEIEACDERVDEPNRIVGVDVIINRLRQQQELRALESGDVSHARF